MRFSDLRNVDFPQPLGPMRAVTRRAGMPSETSWRTWLSPYHRFRLSTSKLFMLLLLLAETDAEGKQIWSDRETEQLRTVRREIEKAWGVSL